MDFHPTPGCCTANLIYNFDETLGKNVHPRDKIAFIKKWLDPNQTTLPLKQDFALLFSITTHTQKAKADSLKQLGFTEAFVGDKKHPEARQLGTGALTMWCISPPILKANLQNLLKTLDPEVSAEEKARRAELPELKLLSVQRSEVYRSLYGERRLYRNEPFPMGMGPARRLLMKLVLELTGGWEMSKDQFVKGNKANLNWGMVKDQATNWRAGNC